MIRVLIAEDSAVTREYLRWLIDEAMSPRPISATWRKRIMRAPA